MIKNVCFLITSKELIAKKIFAIMLMMVIPMLSWAAPYTLDHEGFTYYGVIGRDVSIVACSQDVEHIDVPASIIHDEIVYNVTGISANVFKDKTTLKSISFPDGLTYIGTSAFEGCTNLTTITLPPTTLVEIGSSAFKGCTKLKSINLPSSLTTIGDGAFEGAGLTSINIPDNVTSIGSDAFKDCTALTLISIPSGVETISSGLFYGCTGLKNIVIANGVKRIEAGFCDGCTGLVSLSIPMSVTYIESSAFRGCTGKVTINCSIPNPTFYDHGTFRDSQITEVVMGDSVKSIGRYAFGGCTTLTTVTIGQNVTNIGDYAFDGCTGLTSIIIPDALTSIGGAAFRGCTSLTSATLGNGMQTIGSSAFAECSNLQSVAIPTGAIGNNAFANCSKLENLTLGNGVTSIGDVDGGAVFEYCSSLKVVSIPSSVIIIGRTAFYGCTGLQSITIPSTVTTIGQYAFGGGCTGKATINCSIPDNTEAFSYDCRFSEIVIGEGVTRVGNNAFRGNPSLLSLTLPGGLQSIGSNAFYDCQNLASVYIPASVTSIEDSAFLICRKLTLAPGSVLSCEIGNSAFDGCISLTSVTFGNGVGNIGEYAFRSCTELATVTVPEGVTKMKYIGQYAFSECGKMTSFDFPSSLDSLGYSAFEKCNSLNAIHLKEGVRVLEGSTFFGCSGVTSVSLPSTLQKIGGNDFNGCQGTLRLNGNLPDIPNVFSSPFSTAKFNHVVLGEGVTKLDDGTFYGCWTLMNVTVERPNPISIYSNVFPNRSNSTLYCPKDGKSKYMAEEFWKEFQNIKGFPDPDVNQDGFVDVVDVVDIARFVVGTPSESFDKILADLNGSGEVNVGDAVVLVNEIAGDVNWARSLRSPAVSDGILTLTRNIDQSLSFSLEDNSAYTAFQFDLMMPKEMDVTQMTLNSLRKQNHQLFFNKISEGHYRVVALSTSNNTFNGTAGELLNMSFNSQPTDDIVIDNIHFVTAQGNDFLFNTIGISGNTPTSISGVRNYATCSDGKIYNLNGQRLTKTKKGLYIINGHKALIK